MYRIWNAAIITLVCTMALLFSPPSRAACAPGAKAAATGFMNAYIKWANAFESNQTKIDMAQWLQANKRLTAHFKESYKALLDEANKENPGMGLDFDPVVNAQDFPDKGFEPERCESSGYVVLRGVDWPTFKVTVKVVKTAAGWRVDGAGVVNIPSNKQAHMQ